MASRIFSIFLGIVGCVKSEADGKINGMFFIKHSMAALLLALAIFATLFSGCTYTHNIKPEPPLGSLPEVTKEPLTVGVYYSPEFSTYEDVRYHGSNKFVARIGNASVALFDRVFPMAFEKVVTVTEGPPFGGEGTEIAAAIEPSIEAFNFALPFEKSTDQHSITYRFTMYTTKGVPFSSWTVWGKGPSKPKTPYPMQAPVRERIELNMQDAAVKFLSGFRTSSGADRIPFGQEGSVKINQASVASLDESAVLASVEPLVHPERLKEEFDSPIDQAGIIAINVSVTNKGIQRLLVRDSDIRLVLPNGRRIAPAGTSLLAARLAKPGQADAVTVGLLGAPLGGLVQMAEAAEEKKKRLARQNDFRAKQLGERVLGKNDSAQGFVYFMPAAGTPAFNQADLVVWFVDPETARGVQLKLPLKELGFKGAPAKK